MPTSLFCVFQIYKSTKLNHHKFALMFLWLQLCKYRQLFHKQIIFHITMFAWWIFKVTSLQFYLHCSFPKWLPFSCIHSKLTFFTTCRLRKFTNLKELKMKKRPSKWIAILINLINQTLWLVSNLPNQTLLIWLKIVWLPKVKGSNSSQDWNLLYYMQNV